MPYSRGQGRKFGLTVGIAFLVIALISLWRGHDLAPKIFGAFAAILIVAALVAPRALERVDAAWMKLAHAISRVTTPVFMSIVYFVVLTPIGILRRRIGRNPMVHEADNGSYWITRPPKDAEKQRLGMERQF
ncbi:MAG TPA: SxtJ family membrane protein [Gemmatimonadaceae bacterium]